MHITKLFRTITKPRFSNSNTVRALLLGVLAFVVWSCGDACTKFIGKGEIPVIQIITIASLAGSILIALAAFLSGGIHRLKPTNLRLQIPMVATLLVMSIANVIAFTHLPLTTVYAAFFTSPLIVSIFGAIYLHERLGTRQSLYIIAGFAGALIAINPFNAKLEGLSFMAWALLPLLPLLFSAYMVLSRSLRLTATSESISFFPTFTRALLFLPFAIIFWVPMTAPQFLANATMGIAAGMGALLMTKALAQAPSATISPLQYLQLVTGALLDLAIWGFFPTWHMAAGGTIIVVAGIAGARLACKQQSIREAVFETLKGT